MITKLNDNFNYLNYVKGSRPVQVTNLALIAADWVLQGSTYVYTLLNCNITANNIVDVIPDNNDLATVLAASFLIQTISVDGAVYIYANNLPAANIGVTINIF